MLNPEWKRLMKKIAVLDREGLQALNDAIDRIIIEEKRNNCENHPYQL